MPKKTNKIFLYYNLVKFEKTWKYITIFWSSLKKTWKFRIFWIFIFFFLYLKINSKKQFIFKKRNIHGNNNFFFWNWVVTFVPFLIWCKIHENTPFFPWLWIKTVHPNIFNSFLTFFLLHLWKNLMNGWKRLLTKNLPFYLI